MWTVITIVSVILAARIGSAAAEEWSYDIVRQSGKFCPEKDSCRFNERKSRDSVEVSWRDRNCFCDNLCATFGDCCVDAPSFSPDTQRRNYGQFECARLREYGHIYMRTRCAEDWRGADSVREACEGAGGGADPLLEVPATNTETGATYRNYQCAVCSGDTAAAAPGQLQLWTPRLECPTLDGYNQRFGNISRQSVLDSLRYDGARGWGVDFDTSGVAVFHPCEFHAAMPDHLSDTVRNCSPEPVVAACPAGYEDAEVRARCESYTGLMFHSNDSTVYRNTYCATCNDVPEEDLICIRLDVRGRQNFHGQIGFRPVSFAILFDLSSVGGDTEVSKHQCLFYNIH